MSRLVICTALVAILAYTSVEGTLGTVLRGYGLNGQYYTGSGVGPLWMFRSSADNAALVNEGLRGKFLQRAIALALGDEFPRLRDDLIQRAKEGSRYGSGSSSATATDGDEAGSTDATGAGTGYSSSSSSSSSSNGRASPLASFTNFQNWRYDRENSKNEFTNPYRRANPLSSVVGLVGSLGSRIGSGSGGSGGGILSSVTGLLSSFASGGGSSSSSSSSSGSSGSNGFRISVDTPTRSPNSI